MAPSAALSDPAADDIALPDIFCRNILTDIFESVAEPPFPFSTSGAVPAEVRHAV